MDATSLATELAELEGVEHQFDALVRQIIANRRQAATSRIMRKPGTTPSEVAREMATLDQALRKVEENLRSQYDVFLSAHVTFRADRLTTAEMLQYVAALRDERVQDYFERMRALHEEAGSVLSQVTEEMLRAALTPTAKTDAVTAPTASRS